MPINLHYFENIRSQFDEKEMPFLSSLLKRMEKERPYVGLRFYHNIPLTLTTLIKIETLLRGGAEVIVSNMRVLETPPEIIQQLTAAGVTVDIEKKNTHAIDVYLDCVAEMIYAPAPRLGYVELTQSGTEIYRQSMLTTPVISVDDSPIKVIETIGTGEGFVRGMREYANFPLNNRKVVLFGYGKVGYGIHSMLVTVDANTIIIDKKQDVIKSLNDRGYTAYHIDEIDLIKSALSTADCAVTATGCTRMMSQLFERNDFPPHCRLVNMGATDEFGEKFSSQDVLFNKKPINFALKLPTLLKFLDPTFYAHNIAVDYFLSNTITQGYHSFPEKQAKIIVDQWQNYHHISVNDLISSFA